MGWQVGAAGGVMGQGGVSLGCGWIARLSVVAGACLALAACSAAPSSRLAQRTYGDGEPIPKGGGTYKVGQPYRLNGRTYQPSEDPGYRAEGMASWYGPDFHGKRTANGELYDMHSISAAHTTLPIPSYARVTNLRNGRSIVVRVNDRGPYVGNRLIDLSIGTAKALDFYGEGLTRVLVEYVGRAPLNGSDDRRLMATLRHGSPAPAPSQVMVASAKPFVPSLDEAGEKSPAQARANATAPIPADRPFVLGAPMTPKVAAKTPAPETPAPTLAQAKSLVTLPVRPRKEDPAAPAAGPWPAPNPPPTAAYAPLRMDGSLGLMSGRGLY
jgi:rare lipoprotein A